jgi:hypothetical protein
MPVNTNLINVLEGIMFVVELKDKDQAVRLELAEFFILSISRVSPDLSTAMTEWN